MGQPISPGVPTGRVFHVKRECEMRYQIWPANNMNVLISWGNGQNCAGYGIWDSKENKRVPAMFNPGVPALFNTLARAVQRVRELEF